MREIFQHLFYALISPQHLHRALSRFANADLKRARFTQNGDDGDEEDDPADEGDAPWWKKQDIWGDPLPAPRKAGSTAIVPVKGIITTGYPTIFRAVGVADAEEIGGWVRAARNDSSVSRIVMPYDSPGGIYSGTPELAAEIDAATLVKPVIAHTKGMMDSAAFWAASQSTELYCTQSADVGCIGVYQVHYDWSAWLASMGIRAEMFKSGDLKGAGHPDIPLTNDQREHIQSEIAAIGNEFKAAVKSKRTLVSEDSMRGQSFIGSEAAARNLVNGIRSFESLL